MKRLRLADAVLDAIDEVQQLPIDPAKPPARVTVCFKSASGEIFGHMTFPGYEHVHELDARLRKLGYGMSILHPQETGCDFVVEDLVPPEANRGGGSPADLGRRG